MPWQPAAAGETTVTDTTSSSAPPGGVTLELPAHFPPPQAPDDNPLTTAKVELGRFLFYDRRLSGNGRQACASCHRPELAFTDGRVNSIGSTGEAHPRNAQSLANVAYNPTLTWANPALVSLEAQMLVPLFGTSPVEMGVNDANKDAGDAAPARRCGLPGALRRGLPRTVPTRSAGANVVKAIASFQRTLISGDSQYDQYLQGQATLSDAEERGMHPVLRREGRVLPLPRQLQPQRPDRARRQSPRLRRDTVPQHRALQHRRQRRASRQPNRGVFESSFKPQ